MLVEALPDLALLVSLDGIVVAHGGGRDTTGLTPSAEADGKPLEASWPEPIAALLRRLTRKSIAQRMAAEARFVSGGSEYTVQVSPRGPDRAVCVIRPAGGTISDDPSDSGLRPAPRLEQLCAAGKASAAWSAFERLRSALHFDFPLTAVPSRGIAMGRSSPGHI